MCCGRAEDGMSAGGQVETTRLWYTRHYVRASRARRRTRRGDHGRLATAWWSPVQCVAARISDDSIFFLRKLSRIMVNRWCQKTVPRTSPEGPLLCVHPQTDDIDVHVTKHIRDVLDVDNNRTEEHRTAKWYYQTRGTTWLRPPFWLSEGATENAGVENAERA